MDRVAAEVAEEVVVLFEYGDVDSCSREQIAEHHARRSGADDAHPFHGINVARPRAPGKGVVTDGLRDKIEGMRIAYLDCFAGISGDMFLGALLEAGVAPRVLQDAAAAMRLGASLKTQTVDRSGISCTKVHVFEGARLAESARRACRSKDRGRRISIIPRRSTCTRGVIRIRMTIQPSLPPICQRIPTDPSTVMGGRLG